MDFEGIFGFNGWIYDMMIDNLIELVCVRLIALYTLFTLR